MFSCLQVAFSAPLVWSALLIGTLAVLVMSWTLKTQRFPGKGYYALTFLGVTWTLPMVAADAVSVTPSCELTFSALAWLGHVGGPVAWCFFIMAYVNPAHHPRHGRRLLTLAVLPPVIAVFAGTSGWHQLVYVLPREAGGAIGHGPGYYAVVLAVYPFVLATLLCLLRGFARARRSAWPFLTMLLAITCSPLIGNLAYTLYGVTVFGLNPTAPLFTLGIFAFTWLTVTNKTMDMPSVGQSTLFDTMSEPVVLLDRQYRVVRSNLAAQRSGVLDHPELGAPLLAKAAVLKDGAFQLQCRDRIYEPRVQPIGNPLNPEGPGISWSITFVDETDRIAATVALQEALKRADDANRAKDEFISVVSHELRTPLTSMRGGLALALSGKLGEMPAPVRGSLDIAHRNGLRLSRLVDNILLAQKLDVETLNLEWQPVALHQLLQESVEENRMFAEDRGVTLVVGPEAPGAVILGDAFALRQVIDNLISNAIKFSDQGGKVEGWLSTKDGRVRLSVKDAGRGIPPGSEAKVFGRFQQIADGGQKSTQGSGLGLHIARRLTRQMGGELSYDSTPGKGATFHMAFRAQSNTDHAPQKAPAPLARAG